MNAEINVIFLHFHNTRNTHHSLPFPIHRFRHTEPCCQDSSATLIQSALWCIKVCSIIKELVFFRQFHITGFFIKCYLHAYCLCIFCLTIFKQLHRWKDHYLAVIHFKIIRAFPHPAKVFSGYRIFKFPFFSICTCEEQKFSLFIIDGTSKHHVPSVPVFPDFWISCMACISDICIVNNRNHGLFVFDVVKMNTILRSDHELCRYKMFIHT